MTSPIFEPPLRGQNPVNCWSGVVAADITDEADPMFVLLDNWEEDVRIGPCRWMPRPSSYSLTANNAKKGVTVKRATNLSIPNGAWTLITWDAEETADPNNMWSAGNPARLVAPATGRYRIFAHLVWTLFALAGIQGLNLQVNTEATPGASRGGMEKSATGGITNLNNLYSELDLTAGDYIALTVFQNAGGTSTLNGAASSSFCRFGMYLQDEVLADTLNVSTILPHAGDPCLVTFDSNNQPWVTSWWPYA